MGWRPPLRLGPLGSLLLRRLLLRPLPLRRLGLAQVNMGHLPATMEVAIFAISQRR